MTAKNIVMAAAGARQTDPNDAYTSLVLMGEGNQGGQNNTFLDSSSNNLAITRYGNTTQGTFSPFSKEAGKWGVAFDGSGDYLQTASSANLTPGSGAFTVECWIYPTGTAGVNVVDNRPTFTNGMYFAFGILANGQIGIMVNAVEGVVISAVGRFLLILGHISLM
jgi:hypothetical protein